MAAIKNYGLHWERGLVDFGGPGHGKKGSLKGAKRGAKKRIVDFREQIGVYVLYDENLKPVYVGQAGGGKNDRLFNRLKQHRRDHLRSRWTHFSWFGMREVNSSNQSKDLSSNQKPESKLAHYSHKDALNEIEGILIATLEPNLNRQGGKWKGAYEYLQYADDDLVTTRKDIYEKLEELEEIVKSIDR